MGNAVDSVKEKVSSIVTEKGRSAFTREVSFFFERAKIFKEIALLSQDEFNGAIEELNSILLNSCKSSSTRTGFVHNQSSSNFSWKTSARVYCFRVEEDGTALLTRCMDLIKFWVLRNEILHHVGQQTVIENFGEFQFVDMDGQIEANADSAVDELANENNLPADSNMLTSLSDSAIFARVEAISSEEMECCICMENKSNVSLSCAHCFCGECIKSWSASRSQEESNCPICRQKINHGEEFWEMTDAPNKEEMRQYVLSLASGI